MSIKNDNDKKIRLLSVLLLVGGLAAGFLGGLIAQQFSGGYSSSLSSDLDLNGLDKERLSRLVISEPKKVVVNQDLKLSETINNIKPVIVGVFSEIATSTEKDLSGDYYDLRSPLFSGLITTSDGWVIASVPKEIKNGFRTKGYVAIDNNRHLYHIDQIYSRKDIPGDLLIFHLSGAKDLPVKKISSRSEISLGENLVAVKSADSAWPTSLSSVADYSGVLDSDTLRAEFTISGQEKGGVENSFAFDLSGSLVAVVSRDNQAIPAFTLNNLWRSLAVKGASSTAPSLGVNYLDLSLSMLSGTSLEKGALIYPDADKVAVKKDSPAQTAGLKEGDIITWVNNQQLDSSNGLAEVVSRYQAGDKVVITYLRDNQEKEVEVKLGVLK